MPNEEYAIAKMIQTTVFMLFMLFIGVFFGPEWSIIALLSLIYMR
jgi:hypothetical protein|tara:strand:+ start:3610 stop:3744 length:135 start_codon:yes stop_codon:yes gene_type:complete